MFSLFFLLSNGYAEPQFTKLSEGETAPWAGRLFNDEAVAKFIVEDRLKVDQCEIQTEYALKQAAAFINLDHQLEIINIQTEAEILKQKVALRDERIQDLEKIKSPPNSFLYATVGFIFGASATIGIVHAVK